MSEPREYANEEAHLVHLPLDPGASDALRRLADWLDADEDRCLIGAWVLETDLQVTVTTTRGGAPMTTSDLARARAAGVLNQGATE